MTTAVEVLQREIEELENQLRIRRAALAQLTSATPIKISEEKGRFAPPMRPSKAARLYLEEIGKAVPQADLIDALVAGGATEGKKRGRHNIRLAIESALTNGHLINSRGRIGLPEWPNVRFD